MALVDWNMKYLIKTMVYNVRYQLGTCQKRKIYVLRYEN